MLAEAVDAFRTDFEAAQAQVRHQLPPLSLADRALRLHPCLQAAAHVRIAF